MGAYLDFDGNYRSDEYFELYGRERITPNTRDVRTLLSVPIDELEVLTDSQIMILFEHSERRNDSAISPSQFNFDYQHELEKRGYTITNFFSSKEDGGYRWEKKKK